MATLFEKIKYNNKFYTELTDTNGRNEIEDLVVKLRPLEEEIVADPKGMITIMTSGNVFTDSFEPELAGKIANLISGH